jgi:hypothetical protein
MCKVTVFLSYYIGLNYFVRIFINLYIFLIGFIPSYDETFNYGKVILTFISNTLKELKITSEEFIVELTEKFLSRTNSFKDIEGATLYKLDTITSFNTQNKRIILKCEMFDDYNLSSGLERIENQKRKKGYIYSFIDFLKDNPNYFV